MKVSGVGAISDCSCGVWVSTGKNPVWFNESMGPQTAFLLLLIVHVQFHLLTQHNHWCLQNFYFVLPAHCTGLLHWALWAVPAMLLFLSWTSSSWNVLAALRKARDLGANTVCNLQLKFRHRCEHKEQWECILHGLFEMSLRKTPVPRCAFIPTPTCSGVSLCNVTLILCVWWNDSNVRSPKGLGLERQIQATLKKIEFLITN